MNRLMTQLKSAGSTGDARAIDLIPLVRALVRARAGSRPEPRLEVQVGELPVLAEPDRLTSVIGHIIQNAQDATPPDGVIVVRLSTKDSQALVDIQDNGSGMEAEFIETRLFKPFDSTKGLTGMGIGAYECREVVRSLGGQVSVESQPGQGTTFSIAIPLAAYG
jgi:signal transduction histidine kinase